MALGFPTNPTLGQTYTTGSGQTYVWNGSAWAIQVQSPQTVSSILSTGTITVGTGTQTVLITGGAIYVNGGSIVTTASMTTTMISIVNRGDDIDIRYNTATNTITWSNTSTFQSVTGRGASTTNIVNFTNTSNSISTLTGAVIVTGGIGVGKDLYVGGTIYQSGGTVALSGSSISQNTSSVIVTDTGTVHNVVVTIASNTNTTFSSTGVTINSTQASTSTTTGALVVSGGVGVAGDLWVQGRVNSESVKIQDAVLDSTVVSVNTTATTTIDRYSADSFRAAKYLIQVDSGSGAGAEFQVIELLLLIDNIGTVYATEYGLLTSNGELGEFSAEVDVSNMVNLYFTPYSATNKVIFVLRTGIAV